MIAHVYLEKTVTQATVVTFVDTARRSRWRSTVFDDAVPHPVLSSPTPTGYGQCRCWRKPLYSRKPRQPTVSVKVVVLEEYDDSAFMGSKASASVQQETAPALVDADQREGC